MSPSTIAILALSTVVLGTVAHAFTLALLRNRNVVDVPNHRSSHTVPTVRGGGLGITVALLAGLAVATFLVPLDGASRQIVSWFRFAIVAFAFLGWIEDVRGLKVQTRLGAQALISAVVAVSAAALFDLPVPLVVLAALGGVFYVNAANFMDGVNGISSWHGIIVGAYFGIVGLASGSPELSLMGIVTAAAFLSFLPWNAPRARMFMGDVGSYALGGAALALCVYAVGEGTPLLVALAPLMVYAADVLTTIVRRARRGEHLHHAHREHTYQLVQQITGSHGIATLLASTATVACAAIGLLSLRMPELIVWVLPLIGIVLVAYLATPKLLKLGRFGSAQVQVER